MTRRETLEQATELLTAMNNADFPTVARLAHALHDLAEQEHLDEVAEASTDIEQAAASHRPVSLTPPLNRLSQALQAAEQCWAA